MNPWMTLLLAGLFEVGFTTALKMEQKNKNWFWVFLACAWISFGFLAEAIKAIPLGRLMPCGPASGPWGPCWWAKSFSVTACALPSWRSWGS